MFSKRANSPLTLEADAWLTPYREELRARQLRAAALETRLTGGRMSLADFASAHEFYGLHRVKRGWIFREYAPHADGITLVGDFSGWQELPEYRLTAAGNGVWEVKLPVRALAHGQRYALQVRWPGGGGLRLPACTRYALQDERTKLFSAVVHAPEHPYVFRHPAPPRPEAQLIYEAHVGIAQEAEKVGTYEEFRRLILPEIARKGYNTVQLMGIMEHPYYGSFGYHVSNFFAVSSRFGTPEEFKALVDAAHGLGLRVVMDLIHSHSVRNELEGLSAIDGDRTTYFHGGDRGIHPAWDSYCFDYGKIPVLHFLLSNCRFYLDEYHVDGFRFDGVTSMLYRHHGLYRNFTGYGDYFSPEVDQDALAYLTLANKVIHQVNPQAVTIAEDVSGMPGLANPAGIGFDYRMAMGVTDMWFKMLDIPDENWDMFHIYGELTNRRRDERSISYVECHDQAIVGGKTAIFRMADADMYYGMHRSSGRPAVDRASALHKIFRLLTAATAGHGYLNFMGNEFGAPEWIDLPREGNNWSLAHARRQWSLEKDPKLRFGCLSAFDRAVLQLVSTPGFYQTAPQCVKIDNDGKILVFERNGYWFCVNLHPESARTDYPVCALPGSYTTVLDSDAEKFDGFNFRTPDQRYFTIPSADGDFLHLYLPPRTALVLHFEH